MKPTLSQLETRFVDLMIEQAKLGRPYVWGGKGDKLWTPKGVIANPFADSHGEVFDCAGLIATMLYRAGGPDVRFTHRAKDLQAELKAARDRGYGSPFDTTDLRCRFYPGHIAFTLRSAPLVIIEAAGGDSTTLAPKPGGRVRWGRERRTDFLAELSLSGWLRARGYA